MIINFNARELACVWERKKDLTEKKTKKNLEKKEFQQKLHIKFFACKNKWK